MLTYQLLPSLQCIHLRTQNSYLNKSYLVRSADQRSFSFFHWQLLQLFGVFFLISSLLCSANSSRLVTKSIIKFCWSFLYKKMGSSIRFDDIKTEIGTCFPIQVVVCLSFNSSVGTQIDSKSKIVRLLKSLLSSETGRLNPSRFSNKVYWSSYTFFG